MKYFRFLLRYNLKIMKMEASTVATAKKSIQEGQAEIRLTSEKVFYNPVQEFNRDLSIAVLSVFTKDYMEEKLTRALKVKKSEKIVNDATGNGTNPEIPVTILEALSATGLRSIRYAKEVPNITKIIANDLSEQAVETIKSNIVHNGVEDLIETSHDDACMLMYKHKHPSQRFAAIDLDPYGCPSIFLDSAVQSVQDGGLLLVTATDMAVLAGNSPETCYCKYGAVSLKTKCCHEMALRILLQCIEQHANRYSRYIVPLLSISADFYIRVFVKIYSGAIHCKKTTSKLSMVYHCVGCDNITLQPLGGFKPNPTEKNPQQTKGYLPAAPPVGEYCSHCNQRHHLGGPIWSAPIHDDAFVSRVLTHVQDNPALFGTAKRMRGVLAMVREELPDAPLYYTQDKLFGRVHLETMPMLTMRYVTLLLGAVRHRQAHARRAGHGARGAARRAAVLHAGQTVREGASGDHAHVDHEVCDSERGLQGVVLARRQAVHQDSGARAARVGHHSHVGKDAPCQTCQTRVGPSREVHTVATHQEWGRPERTSRRQPHQPARRAAALPVQPRAALGARLQGRCQYR
ncbi:probable tRNA (guanine(26)-N(2))-dimethyltransferase isoform X1 [Bicyclus anynana]|uniref:tRNA (guanine(26)-N(2))-dimethyltransferase n=1 Tax=Bicyclus anynana TaxID=110368 RepID=A0ABM3LTK9_BICAN|nr:probable tRNA (guanine(26)-N(2))-dimethyltransferase isoform X1 [Bicyclus anynana]